MTINIKDVEKAAKLARIAVEPQEKAALTKRLNNIINWMAVLEEVDTNSTEILSNVHKMALPLFPDLAAHNNNSEEILKNSVNKYNYFIVTKILE